MSQPTATVEAEYGDTVIKGIVTTLAHHANEYKDYPAPCNAPDVPVLVDGGNILVSHIDLDTVGGVAALLGIKPNDDKFWEAAEFIDLNGAHHLHQVPDQAGKLNAYWAWAASLAPVRYTDATDVSMLIHSHIDTIQRIIDGDTDLLSKGEQWAEERISRQESCLVQESDKLRVFVTDDFRRQIPSAYYSPNLGKVVPIVVTLNTATGAITLSCADSSINAKGIMQSIFGPEAGGHNSIAGSPRGQRAGLEELLRLVKYIE
ncbi:hypothetical protein ACIFOE_04650 [Paenibacillus sp. NRS-1783]|uniref:hypothetical protein n=1 Tax=Paenibacillus sp. NRS-1783 TaxID=3233907 RepID=UPI003D272DF4